MCGNVYGKRDVSCAAVGVRKGGGHAPTHMCVGGCVVVSRVMVQTDKVCVCVRVRVRVRVRVSVCVCVCVCVCLSQVYGAQNRQWAQALRRFPQQKLPLDVTSNSPY